MPKGADFWNPYRWVRTSDHAVLRETPLYHHRLSGTSGRLWCEIEALTPIFVGDGSGTGEFVRRKRSRKAYIPATSLKGVIRSLVEIVGNAAVPFPKVAVDDQHQLSKARDGAQFDVAARMFGYLHEGNVFAGLIRFSDAEITETNPPQSRWSQYKVAVGQPKSDHTAFYPSKDCRKFYHHHCNAKELVRTHVRQAATVRPAPPGTRFRFTLDFANLRDAEVDLLLYCLVLEEQATAILTPAALGRSANHKSVTLTGPLRHKLGGAKPHGAGSVRMSVTKMAMRADPAARYRGCYADGVLEGPRINEELLQRTTQFRERTDQTMQELRSMMIYTDNDPRHPIQYPTYDWFRTGSQTPLKPTT